MHCSTVLTYSSFPGTRKDGSIDLSDGLPRRGAQHLGPFLVIAPASTLHNWQQEISRFVPGLKALPYWGNTKDRAVLRKFWNRKSLRYDKDAPFHILVTSYQLVSTPCFPP